MLRVIVKDFMTFYTKVKDGITYPNGKVYRAGDVFDVDENSEEYKLQIRKLVPLYDTIIPTTDAIESMLNQIQKAIKNDDSEEKGKKESTTSTSDTDDEEESVSNESDAEEQDDRSESDADKVARLYEWNRDDVEDHIKLCSLASPVLLTPQSTLKRIKIETVYEKLIQKKEK